MKRCAVHGVVWGPSKTWVVWCVGVQSGSVNGRECVAVVCGKMAVVCAGGPVPVRACVVKCGRV